MQFVHAGEPRPLSQHRRRRFGSVTDADISKLMRGELLIVEWIDARTALDRPEPLFLLSACEQIPQSANTLQSTRVLGGTDVSGRTAELAREDAKQDPLRRVCLRERDVVWHVYCGETLIERDKSGRVLQSVQNVAAGGIPRTQHQVYAHDFAGRLESVTIDWVMSCRGTADRSKGMRSSAHRLPTVPYGLALLAKQASTIR
jgi:hypothetical protein